MSYLGILFQARKSYSESRHWREEDLDVFEEGTPKCNDIRILMSERNTKKIAFSQEITGRS
jgi:hypothetical protein